MDLDKRFYPAAHHGGSRDLSSIRVIVVHSTEGATAAGAASWFKNAKAQGSAHVVVDENESFLTLDDNVVPWAAPGTNLDGLHIEIAGFAAWSRVEWLKDCRIGRAAAVIAEWCTLHNIPANVLTVAELQEGKRGITSHQACTTVYSKGQGHTDPGLGFPFDVLLESVWDFLEPRETQR